MKYIYIILVIGLFAFLVYQYFQFRKAQANTPGYARRKAIYLLFLGFIALIGISNVFADALFELLKLEKPENFELMSFLAYVAFAIATAVIMRPGKQEDTKKEASTIHHENSDGQNVLQTNTGKDGRNIVTGRDYIENQTINEAKKKVDPKRLTTLPRINPKDIIGREEELAQLRTLLNDNKQVVVVNGMGGVGKTTLAMAYAFQYEDDYQHIAWITQNSDNITAGLIQNEELLQSLAIRTEGMEPEQLLIAILQALRNLPGTPKLLIIDNATQDLEKHLDQLPSQPNWHLLITSREKISDLTLLPLDFLSEEKAIALFQKYCNRIKDQEAIREIVQVIEYHTLTIEILAKTAERNRTELPRLKQALKNDLKANVKTQHSKTEKIDRVTSYLGTIFDLEELDEHEIWLLKNLSCLPPEFHTFDEIKELIDPEPNDRKRAFPALLSDLERKGWITCNRAIDSYKMHRVTSEVVKKIYPIKTSEVENLIRVIIDKITIDQTIDNPIEKISWIPYGKNILTIEFEDHSPIIARLQNNLAGVLSVFGDYDDAKRLFKSSIKLSEEFFGFEHNNTLYSYSNFALLLNDIGNYQEAKKLLLKVKNLMEKKYGIEDIRTMKAYSNLALVLTNLKEYQKAKILFEKVMISNIKTFGEEHPNTLITYTNLASVFHKLKDYQFAELFYRKSMVLNKKIFGPDHPITANSLANLSILLQSIGNYNEAQQLIEKAICSDEKNFGHNHPTTALRYWTIATFFRWRKKNKEALQYSKKSLAVLKEKLPADHPNLIQVKQLVEELTAK